MDVFQQAVGSCTLISYKCRVELPAQLMGWHELRNNLCGDRNAHFEHVHSQCPGTKLSLAGNQSAVSIGGRP